MGVHYYMDDLLYLEKLGFSTNEAKIYTTLLKHKMLNGYEISKYSGVIRASVYDVLNRMVNRGTIFKIDGEPAYYRPLEYEKLIEQIKRETEVNLEKAQALFQSISSEEMQEDYVLNIVGFEKFIAKAKELIDSATQEISLSVWQKEFSFLHDSLNRAIGRGVKVYLFSFEQIPLQGATVFSYRICDIDNLFPYRRTALIVDNQQALIGESHIDRGIFTYTRNRSIVSLATDEMVLNIFGYRYIEKKALLGQKNTSKEFLSVMDRLADELGIDANMTKNMQVFNYQRERGDHNGDKT